MPIKLTHKSLFYCLIFARGGYRYDYAVSAVMTTTIKYDFLVMHLCSGRHAPTAIPPVASTPNGSDIYYTCVIYLTGRFSQSIT